jgi:AbiU2
MQPLPLDQRLERLGQHIVRARLFLDLWFYFEGPDTRPRIFEIMEEFNEFFRFMPHAYFVAYVIYIAGVFDKRRGTISLWSLVPEVKKEGRIDSQNAATLDALLVEAKALADKVAILRHEAFAHRSESITYDDVFKKAGITPNQLRDLTDIALKIGNSLLLSRGLRDQYFTDLPREAAEAMMNALHRVIG